MTYDSLACECFDEDIEIYELNLRNKGLYADGIIYLNKQLSTTEKKCILAEELGHHKINCGDILDLNDVSNLKQELLARSYAIRKLVSLQSLIDAFQYGCRTKTDLIEYLDVTEIFLEEAIDYYIRRYGIYHKLDGYTIIFSPLGIIKPLINSAE